MNWGKQTLKTIIHNGKAIQYFPRRISHVYYLYCPIKKLPFYVGRTHCEDLSKRLQIHTAPSNKNKMLAAKIRWIRQRGYEPEIHLIASSDYLQLETEYIKDYAKKYFLLNRTNNKKGLKQLFKDLTN